MTISWFIEICKKLQYKQINYVSDCLEIFVVVLKKNSVIDVVLCRYVKIVNVSVLFGKTDVCPVMCSS